MKTFSFIAVFIFLLLSAKSQNTITLLPDTSAPIINKNIYGHFAEHLGHLIYGGIYIGDTNKTILNIDGIRLDIISALKKLKVPVLRWPGGCFADTYHWKDGIGPRSQRPNIVNTNWGGVTEDNSFGTHDFLKLCELINAQPYISGNVGSGAVQELADWVQYVNFDGKSPMSDLRKKNGHENSWYVKYWGIGNEAWGCGGNMTAEHYADIYRTFVTFLYNTPQKGIFRIASGASDADYHWTETLMKNIPQHLLNGLAVHHYAVIDWKNKSSDINFTDQQYFTSMQRALDMEELVTKHSQIMDKYDPKRRVALVVDEWGGWYNVASGTNPGFLYQQNTMRDAMIAATTLNTFNNHAERIRMANLAQVVNVLQAIILTDGQKMIVTPTYHVMEMYNVHQNAKLIPIVVKSENYQYQQNSLPAISASASIDSLGFTHVTISNIDHVNSQKVNINVDKDYIFQKGRILSSGKIQDHNSFDNPEKITPHTFNSVSIKNKLLQLELPPASVVVLELKIK